MEIKFVISDQKISISGSNQIISGSAGALTFTCDFDVPWNGLTKEIIFTNGDVSRAVLLTSEEPTEVPNEVLEPGKLYVSAVGLAEGGQVKLTTQKMLLPFTVLEAGDKASRVLHEYSPELMEQVLAAMGDLSALTTVGRENLVSAINSIPVSGELGGVDDETIGVDLRGLIAVKAVPMERVTGLTGELDGVKETINGGLSDVGQSLETLGSRMDGFTSLTAGSTTGDAELADIRVAADGTVHASAGTAVREQISGVLNKVERRLSYTEMSEGHFITAIGLVGTNEDFNYYVYDVSGLKNCALRVRTYLYGSARVAVWNSDNEPVYILDEITFGVNEYLIPIPEGGVKLMVPCRVRGVNKLAVSIDLPQSFFELAAALLRDLNELSGEKSAELDAALTDAVNVLPVSQKIVISDAENSSVYTNFDSLPAGSYATIITGNVFRAENMTNRPADFKSGMVLTMSATKDTKLQLCFIRANGRMAFRIYWGTKWTDWNYFYKKEDIETMISSAMSAQASKLDMSRRAGLSMFQRIAVIGDSFASGQIFENIDVPRGTFYELSWGQQLARRNGLQCVNMSSGGLTTRTWLERPRGLALLQSSEPQQLYICALGINDARLLPDYLGTIDDAHPEDPDSNADTFYGNYGRIISAIKAKAPKAKIILSTLAKYTALNGAVKDLAEKYGVVYITQLDDPFFTDDFYTQNMVGGHPTAAVYSGMAKAMERLICKCIVENHSYFADYVG